MDDTVHPITDTQAVDPVAAIVAQLRGAGVDTSTRAVRALTLHADRRALTGEQVVEILARFTQVRWDGLTLDAAQRLLRDISEPDGRGDAVNLLVDVAAASGDAAFHVQLLQSLAAPFGGSRPQATAEPTRGADLPATRLWLLQWVAAQCGTDLPVPTNIDIDGTDGEDIRLELRLRTQAEVDAWASRLGLSAQLEPRILETAGRRWQVYRVDVWSDAAAAAVTAGVDRVNVWCSVDAATGGSTS